MSILTLLIVAALVLGALMGLMWLSRHYGSPLTQTILRIAIGFAILLAVIALLIWTLDYFGVISVLSRVHIPVPRR